VTIRISRDPIYRRRRFSAETIELCVRWYITYRLSYRDLSAMMAEREIVVSHTTVMRWVLRYVPEYERRWARFARPPGSSWRMDETAVSVRGGRHYLYRAVDRDGKSVASLLCHNRWRPRPPRPRSMTVRPSRSTSPPHHATVLPDGPDPRCSTPAFFVSQDASRLYFAPLLRRRPASDARRWSIAEGQYTRREVEIHCARPRHDSRQKRAAAPTRYATDPLAVICICWSCQGAGGAGAVATDMAESGRRLLLVSTRMYQLLVRGRDTKRPATRWGRV